MQGQIIGNISDLYKVKYENGYILCKARGLFRKEGSKLLVGDKVIIDLEKKIITKLLPRDNELIRPPICNVNQALIVISVKKPRLDLYLLDKIISIITYNNIDIIICFTKLDLLDDQELIKMKEIISYYNNIGLKVITNNDIDILLKLLKNKITVITGQSGVGKSSLLNKLDANLKLKTDEISISRGRGKHTTKHIDLLEINNGLIADTPGFSSLTFNDISKEGIRDSFIEFRDIECKYRDCMHLKEDECRIKELVNNGIIKESRYNNYQSFIKEKDDVYGKNSRFNSI